MNPFILYESVVEVWHLPGISTDCIQPRLLPHSYAHFVPPFQ